MTVSTTRRSTIFTKITSEYTEKKILFVLASKRQLYFHETVSYLFSWDRFINGNNTWGKQLSLREISEQHWLELLERLHKNFHFRSRKAELSVLKSTQIPKNTFGATAWLFAWFKMHFLAFWFWCSCDWTVTIFLASIFVAQKPCLWQTFRFTITVADV